VLRVFFVLCLLATEASAATIHVYRYVGPPFALTDGPERVTGEIVVDFSRASPEPFNETFPEPHYFLAGGSAIADSSALLSTRFDGLDLERNDAILSWDFRFRAADRAITFWSVFAQGQRVNDTSWLYGCYGPIGCGADAYGEALVTREEPKVFDSIFGWIETEDRIRHAEGAGEWSVAAIPLPGASWLVLVGPAALFGLARRQARAGAPPDQRRAATGRPSAIRRRISR
jgi:hypothetical protein